MDFTGLYRRYSLDVFRFALHLSGNRAQAEDIAAETFARAWVARDQIRVGTVKAYLLMIARNLYRDQMKERAGRSDPGDAAELPDTSPNPESVAGTRMQLEAVLERLRRLPEPDRAILIMATIEELPYEAIARAVDLSVTAVKVRVHRARLKIQDLRTHKERA
jgi:RNA polymerase sigma factor (sigma-70 family)